MFYLYSQNEKIDTDRLSKQPGNIWPIRSKAGTETQISLVPMQAHSPLAPAWDPQLHLHWQPKESDAFAENTVALEHFSRRAIQGVQELGLGL